MKWRPILLMLGIVMFIMGYTYINDEIYKTCTVQCREQYQQQCVEKGEANETVCSIFAMQYCTEFCVSYSP